MSILPRRSRGKIRIHGTVRGGLPDMYFVSVTTPFMPENDWVQKMVVMVT